MRKRDLLLGLALCGFASVFAQEPIFVYDFDHDGQDSLNGNGRMVIGTDTIWDNIQGAQEIKWRNPEAQRDCTILVYKATFTGMEVGTGTGQVEDSWEIVEESDGNHVFHLITGTTTGAADYQRVLRLYFPDGLIKENSSYRVSYRVKANANAQSELFIVRGIDYNDVRWQYKNGSAQGDQTVLISDFNPEVWSNASGVFFYLTDSLMEAVAKDRASWWTDSWKDAQGIYQPNVSRMQVWMKSENSEYFVDDVKLYKSYIGGAESNQDIIRVNFGYQTNGAALAAATPFGAIDLLAEDPEAVSIVGYYNGEPEQVSVKWAEFHTDGYLYIWADLEDGQDLTEEYYDSVFLSFNNPMPDFVYNGNVYPNALDEEYSKTKVVLGFQNELVIPSDRAFSVSSITQQPPTFVSVEPETGSFNLSLTEDKEFKFKFSKPVYIGEEGASIRLEGAGLGDGKELVLTQDPDDETGVIATLPASIKELNGDYTMVVSCIAVEKGAQTAEPVSFTYTYGDAKGQAMVEFLNSDFWLKLNADQIPLGWTVTDGDTGTKEGDAKLDDSGNPSGSTFTGSRMMNNEGGDHTYARSLYLAGRGSNAGTASYGLQNAANLHLAAGSYYLNIPVAQHEAANTGNAFAKVYNRDNTEEVLLAKTELNVQGVRTTAIAFGANKLMFTVATEGDYVIEISSESGWSGVAVGPVSLTNVYSAAYGYVKALNDQLAINKQLVDDNAEAYAANPLYKEFAANYNENATWSAKQPKQYDAKVQELKDQAAAFNALLKSVADFDAALKNANDVISQNAEGPLASFDEFVALKGLAAQYASYNAFNSLTDENNAAAAALKSSTDGFMMLVKGLDFYQVQPKALNALADSLNFDWSSLPDGVSIAEKIAAQTGHNVDFINVLKTAVTWGIYKKFAQNDLTWMPTKEVEDTLGNISEVPYLDLTTAFIFNPLWCTTHKGDNHIGGYNEMPGWTLSGFDLGNVGDRYYGHAWYNASATDADPFHDSQLGAGWFNGMWATQEISNVPAGQYSIGLGCVTENDSWSVRIKSADSTLLEFKCDINGNWQGDPNQFVTFGTLALDVDKFTFQAGQDGFGGWSQADHPQMILTGLADGFDYVTAEAAMADKFQKAVETIAEEIEGQANGPVVGINGVIYNNEAEAQGFYIKDGAVYFNK